MICYMVENIGTYALEVAKNNNSSNVSTIYKDVTVSKI